MHLILIFIVLSSISSMERGWTHPETGWQVYSGVSMCLFLMGETFIDNEKKWVEPSKVLKRNDQFYYMKNGELSLLKKELLRRSS